MNKKPEVDIGPRDKEILSSLLKQYLPDTAIWVHGSRVKRDAKRSTGAQPWSDLDLVVFTGTEQKYQLSLLREALEESNLTFRVDLMEWNSLPENFKANIKSSYAEL